MTPDELVEEIFRIQHERDPNSDPGDLTITKQDDMDLTEVTQFNRPMFFVGRGGSIQDALEDYLHLVQSHIECDYELIREVWQTTKGTEDVEYERCKICGDERWQDET